MTGDGPPPPNPFGRGVLNGPVDFVPEWDVPSIGRDVTERLKAAISAMDGRRGIDPNRKIQVLLGPPGYGKTHLFGRIAHEIGGAVLFVFVPPIQDVRRPLAHIRHHVVMSVFDESDGRTRSPLARALARLARPSFLKYLAFLPRPIEARHEDLHERLRAEDAAVWPIVDAVKAVEPFRTFAESLAKAHPDLDGNIVRALALGWSPEKDAARRWLRGEILPDDVSARLGLPDEPPDPVRVVEAVASLMAGHLPVILCIDQLDVLLADRENAPLQFSTDMMTLRSVVPNLLILVACLEVEWKLLADRFLASFHERTSPSSLNDLDEDEALALVHRRLLHWPDGPAARPGWWPIDEPSLRRLIASAPQRPRGLLKTCEEAYRDWADEGDLGRAIDLMPAGPVDPPVDPLAAIRDEWEKELQDATRDKTRGPENVQDQRLHKAFLEALRPPTGAGLAIKDVRDGPVPQVAGSPDPYRYTLEAVLDGREGAKSLVVAFEVNHDARRFTAYLKAALKTVEKGDAVGAVFVTARAEVPAGPAARTEIEEGVQKQHLRIVSLVGSRDDFARLETYLTLLEKARAQNLQVGGRIVSAGEFRDLAAKLGVLANLGLFDQIFAGWVAPPERPAEPVVVKPPPPVVTTMPPPVETVPPPPPPPPPSKLDEDGEPRLLWSDDAQMFISRRLGELGARVRARGGPQIGPTFARFLVEPYPSTTINKIRGRAEDLKIGLAVETLPLIGSQGGLVSIDVELPASFRRTVRLRDLPAGPPGTPSFPVGQDVAGETHWLDFSDPNFCHALVAGTTGSGKSEFLKAMIASLAARLGPDRLRFALIDPKQVTFNFGQEPGPFLLRPVALGAEEALGIVEDVFNEGERRFAEMRDRRLEDLGQWQAIDPKAPPRIVVVFDEFADLMTDKATKKALETPLKRLGGKARAAGIHLVLATQRPEASVVTPLLRSNLPARICLKVASEADSKLILRRPDGADLLGRGDLLWECGGGALRLQSPFVDREELERALSGP